MGLFFATVASAADVPSADAGTAVVTPAGAAGAEMTDAGELLAPVNASAGTGWPSCLSWGA
jgi:hypothetical protein